MSTTRSLSGFRHLICLAWALAASTYCQADEPASFSSTPESPSVTAIKKALNETTSLEFIESPLTDVVDYLKQKHHIEIQLDTRSLQDASIEASTTQVTRRMTDVTLRSALHLVLQEYELTYVVRDEALLITSKTAADSMLETRVYPVGDLIYRSEADRRERRYADFQSLIDVLQSIVAPTAWGDGNNGRPMELRNPDCLVITQTQAIHEEAEAFLTTLRRARKAHPPQDLGADDGQLHTKFYRLAGAMMNMPGGGFFQVPSEKAARPAGASDAEIKLQERRLQEEQMERSARAAAETAERLSHIIPELIEPATWKGTGGQGSIHAVNGILIVHQTNPVHRKTRIFLDDFSGSRW